MPNHLSLVTGGAGFIGSHLTQQLLKEGHEVTVVDNFSNGKLENLQGLQTNKNLVIIKEDLKKPRRLQKTVDSSDVIFHLAANPEVRMNREIPRTHFEDNILATFNLLEALRNTGKQKTLVFASTSTVYGDAKIIPTPETYSPLLPISTYGASKLACEALATSYAYTFNHRVLILRLANIIGSRSTHGVIYDFIRKIKTNPKQLTILGDGNQTKSYMHITDCIDAILHLTEAIGLDKEKVQIYNLGSDDQINVKQIAKIVAQTMNTPRIQLKYTGGTEGGRGWKGDVKNMQLSIDKLIQTGWKPAHTSEQAVQLTAEALKQEADPT